MIGRITGLLIEKKPPQIVVDCHGVGYEIEAPMTTIWALPELHEEVSLYTHLAVRDDAHLLYGFTSEGERALFRSLLKVNGVGTKMALVILSGMTADEFAACVHANDAARLTALPGVGKKTAERLIVEMRDRVGQFGDGVAASAAPAVSAAGDPTGDAVAGLIALGYKPQDASRYVHTLDTDGLSSEAIIREVLKSLLPK
ncbi:MAG: Holliday junction branch migration protein RuvA [Gammaproteobacteria bacterium]|nr:Holliday junction branch migration protein RuvA [Gammaproteobacteria bacterium]